MNIWLTKLLLDIAERTRWQWGPFDELYRLRADQREFIEKFSLRPTPDQIQTVADRLSIVEVIPIDKVEAFHAMLVTAIPDLRRYQPKFDDTYRRIVAGSRGAGTASIGRITRRGSGDFGSTTFYVDKLPGGIRSLDLEIRKVLPSFALLFIIARLDEPVTEEIRGIACTQRMPVVRIIDVGLHDPWIRRSEQVPIHSDDQLAEYWSRFTERIRTFLGLSEIRLMYPNLPAIRPTVVYLVRTKEPEDLKTWTDENDFWLRALGIQTFGFSLYGGGGCLFAWATDTFGSDYDAPHHLLVFSDPKSNQSQRVKHREIQAVSTAMALLNWTEALIRQLEDRRQIVFQLLGSRVGHFRRAFKKYFRLSEYIQWQTITSERLGEEVSEELKVAFLQNGVSGFSLVDSESSKVIPQQLADAARMNIEWLVKDLRRHTANVNRAFSEFIAIRNVEVSYSLQRQVLILTLIALLVAIPSIIPTIRWIYDHWIQNLIRH